MKKLFSVKTFSVIGIIAGVTLLILGILVLCGEMGGDMVHAGGAPSRYDSGYATFGADFYTYTVNNAGEAAAAGRAAASNAYEIGHLMKNVYGISFIAAGLFIICLFGTKIAEKAEEKQKMISEQSTEGFNDHLPEI